jgi:hypothetical protein
MRLPFRRVPEGIEIRLDPHEVAFLSQLPTLLETVGNIPQDPAAERLSVPVYLDDPEANEEWWGWMGSELEQSRSADRSAFSLLLDAAEEGVVASDDEAAAFLRVLVEARLVLAARMGVEVESDYARLDDPDAAALDYLGQLQVLLLRTLDPR